MTAPTGGQGEPLSSPGDLPPRTENLLVEMALRNGWPVTERSRQTAVEVTERNMQDADGRTSNGAVRNLILMSQDNSKLRVEQVILEELRQLRQQVEALQGEQST